MRARAWDRGGVLLRPWTGDDVPQLEVAALDLEIARWNPLRVPAHEWCASRADWSGGDHASWAIADPAGPAPAVRPADPDAAGPGLATRVAGSISLHDFEPDATCQVGFWIAPASRGRGLAAAALRAATEFALDELGFRQVRLFHAVLNPGSCGVARSAGYRFVEQMPGDYVYGDGIAHDEHLHVIDRG